jgi:hypothetical protein
MRKFHVACAAVTALGLVLTASAFDSRTTDAVPPGASRADSTQSVAPIRPGHPMVLARGAREPVDGSSSAVATKINSTNWAGYAAAGTDTEFRYVQATFFVPYVDCSTTTNAFSSHWIGLDGLNSQTVEQLGVEAGCAGSTPEFYAWYEMYPGDESPTFFVKPGNSIAASVYYNSATHLFTLALNDTTTGQHFSRSLGCAASACRRSSAEVISESPSDNSGAPLPLAEYRAAGFSGVAVTDSLGHRGTLNSPWWTTYEVIEIGGTSNSVAGQPSSLYRGEAFVNYWFRAA